MHHHYSKKRVNDIPTYFYFIPRRLGYLKCNSTVSLTASPPLVVLSRVYVARLAFARTFGSAKGNKTIIHHLVSFPCRVGCFSLL